MMHRTRNTWTLALFVLVMALAACQGCEDEKYVRACYNTVRSAEAVYDAAWESVHDYMTDPDISDASKDVVEARAKPILVKAEKSIRAAYMAILTYANADEGDRMETWDRVMTAVRIVQDLVPVVEDVTGVNLDEVQIENPFN